MSTKLQALRNQELSPEVWRELVYATLLHLPHSTVLQDLWSFTVQEQWAVLELAQLLPSGPAFTPKNLIWDTTNGTNLVFHSTHCCLSCKVIWTTELRTTQFLHWGCSACREVPKGYELSHSVFLRSASYWIRKYQYTIIDRINHYPHINS